MHLSTDTKDHSWPPFYALIWWFSRGHGWQTSWARSLIFWNEYLSRGGWRISNVKIMNVEWNAVKVKFIEWCIKTHVLEIFNSNFELFLLCKQSLLNQIFHLNLNSKTIHTFVNISQASCGKNQNCHKSSTWDWYWTHTLYNRLL